MGALDLLIGNYSFFLVFKKNCTISFGLGKVRQEIPKNYVSLKKLGMNLVMKIIPYVNTLEKIIVSIYLLKPMPTIVKKKCN
jgi:hypothetical protein